MAKTGVAIGQRYNSSCGGAGAARSVALRNDMPARRQDSTGTTIFQWGYWGWGSATERVVEAFDAVEATRGFAPPMFVDVRINRSVRAAGFREKAFERTLGSERYRWMKALGNKRVETRKGPRVQIAEPAAAEELLDLAIASSRRKQRVVFFCSCPVPVGDDGTIGCHRVAVAKLVIKAAAKRGVRANVVEWPGYEPSGIELRVPDRVVTEVLEGRRKSIPLPEPVDVALYAGLPWGSNVRLRGDDSEGFVIVGPALYTAGRWQLIVEPFEVGVRPTKTELSRVAKTFRSKYGYDPLQT